MCLISERIAVAEDFDLASNILGSLLPEPLKRLMREIQKIAVVPNVPKAMKTALGNLPADYWDHERYWLALEDDFRTFMAPWPDSALPVRPARANKLG